jgi:microcystin-dependent protein
MEAFIGTILPWAGTYAPEGWLFCWGQELQINQNQALFAVIGTQYGGNGTTTFKLPDLRGRFPIGGGFNSATNTNWVPGTSNDSNMKVNIGINNMPAHTHAISNTVTGPTGGTPMSLSLDIGIPVNTDNPNTALVNIPGNNN